jgi:hypothetical protein
MKFVPNAVSRTVARQVLVTQKHSPTLLLIGGSVGIVATAVLTARATLKLEQTLSEIESDIDLVRTAHNAGRIADADLDKTLLYTKAAGYVKLTRLYGPAIVTGAASIAAMAGGHRILIKRNAALAAAYAGLEAAYEEYRERVRKEFGEAKDLEFKRGIQTEIVEEDDGKEYAKSFVDPNGISPYARFFDENNQNWVKTPEYNLNFVRSVQNYMNSVLQSRGHVMLNDVYDALGMERSQAGTVVGWVISKDGDNFVDFGIYDIHSEKAREFVNGQERSILLDFNVDGVVYDKI